MHLGGLTPVVTFTSRAFRGEQVEVTSFSIERCKGFLSCLAWNNSTVGSCLNSTHSMVRVFASLRLKTATWTKNQNKSERIKMEKKRRNCRGFLFRYLFIVRVAFIEIKIKKREGGRERERKSGKEKKRWSMGSKYRSWWGNLPFFFSFHIPFSISYGQVDQDRRLSTFPTSSFGSFLSECLHEEHLD